MTLFKCLDLALAYSNILCWIKAFKIRPFYGEIVTSLAYIFTMQKAPVKIIFGQKCFIQCEPIFKIVVARFKTFGMQKDDMIIMTN